MVGISFKIQGGVPARPFIIGRIKDDEIYRSWQMDHAILTAQFQGHIPDGALPKLQ